MVAFFKESHEKSPIDKSPKMERTLLNTLSVTKYSNLTHTVASCKDRFVFDFLLGRFLLWLFSLGLFSRDRRKNETLTRNEESSFSNQQSQSLNIISAPFSTCPQRVLISSALLAVLHCCGHVNQLSIDKAIKILSNKNYNTMPGFELRSSRPLFFAAIIVKYLRPTLVIQPAVGKASLKRSPVTVQLYWRTDVGSNHAAA